MNFETIRPYTYVALRLPSDTILLTQLQPNATVNLGKYGSFQAKHILGRPYHLTFEILDKPATGEPNQTSLRIVPPAELYADIKDEEASTPAGTGGGTPDTIQDGVQYDIIGENGEVVMRTNRQIIDDPNSQVMTMEEIEAMKARNTGSGQELIAKILDSHSALDQKTAFALAKYTLRKTKKYLKRFTVLPLDVSTLARWIMTEKEPMKIMELREEILALIGSWSNVHCTPQGSLSTPHNEAARIGGGRWLVIDETAGLIVAYLAEKMGILYPPEEDEPDKLEAESETKTAALPKESSIIEPSLDASIPPGNYASPTPNQTQPQPHPRKSNLPSSTNTITVIHANSQPNLSLMKYFNFDPFNPSPSHPLTKHLKTLSWLQLLEPSEDAAYAEPTPVSDEVFQSWKSGKRSNHVRKRRRWERTKFVVDKTRAGGFDGLVVASVMNPISILQHTVPLLRGAAQVVVYSPNIEPLVELVDAYSSARRTAFITNPPDPESMPTEDFPVNPTLLLAPTIQTARARSWQVLPGRTHPLMTGRGGAEGYVFTATRVLPAEGKIEARGNFKRRKADDGMVVGGETAEAVAKKDGGDNI